MTTPKLPWPVSDAVVKAFLDSPVTVGDDPLPLALDAAVAAYLAEHGPAMDRKARAEERANVVRWLRSLGPSPMYGTKAEFAGHFAHNIEGEAHNVVPNAEAEIRRALTGEAQP